MAYEVELTDEFREWFEVGLGGDEQKSITRVIDQLEEMGPTLPFPVSSGIASSRYPHMRELRIQHQGRPFRILYAFDPRRAAILLIGGDKTGDRRWYEKIIPIADSFYERHLRIIASEAQSR
jgi:hypothetical protein